MRFLFLNQYFPPDPAPTGLLLRDIAERLSALGHEVEFASARQGYRGAAGSGSRLVRELKGLLSIFFRGIRARKADVVFSATSPPMLLVVATLLARWHRAKSAHWLFDMYPELAVALGEIRAGVFSGVVHGLMRWCYRRTDIVVALDDDMRARLKSYGVESEVIPPWILHPVPENRAAPARSFVWLYSGNLGRAHEWETLLEAQRILEKRGLPWRLVFQGGGPMRERAQARAQELALTQCEWKGYASEEALAAELLGAEVLIATQRPETKGLLWPSKLALMRALPRRILWVGPREGAIARELAVLPHAGVFSTGEAAEIADWLAADFAGQISARDAVAAREQSLEKWLALLTATARH